MKELTYNRSLVTQLAQEAQNFRNAVNGDVFKTYFGYFSFSKAIFAQANASANKGLLYELLSIDNIKDAQRIVSLLSAANENWVNGEITRRRDVLVNTPNIFGRAEAVKFVDFVDNQIRDLGQRIDRLIAALR